MLPYNFKEENYSVSGFVYEGITTYLGDLYLLRSGVFSLEQYLIELSKQLQKHFDNPARFNYSVGDSSFDTWLDGYTPGAPGRKVSIYTEGCLLAFVTDMKIRQATKDQYGIQEVMKQLYFNFAEKGMGYTWQDYQERQSYLEAAVCDLCRHGDHINIPFAHGAGSVAGKAISAQTAHGSGDSVSE